MAICLPIAINNYYWENALKFGNLLFFRNKLIQKLRLLFLNEMLLQTKRSLERKKRNRNKNILNEMKNCSESLCSLFYLPTMFTVVFCYVALHEINNFV